MRPMTRWLLMAVVAVVASAPLPALRAQVPTAPADGGFILGSPACTTHDKTGAPATSFAPADEIIVRGSAFPAASLVLLTFRQDALTAELGRFRTDGAGAFTTEPTQVRLPSGTSGGAGSVVVSSEGPSATCLIQMASPLPAATARPEPESDDANVLFAIWATLLALGGGWLTFVAYRWWREQRLAKLISEGGRRRRGRANAGPPRLEELAEPPVVPPSGFSYADPPRLPVGWDAGREPTPKHERGRE